ncbi:MAG: hypothetical protein TH68_02050 [Candidatus Synechococcus spongiarum 142]|uniref:Uncharacterized protein n=1 Tax=Candidatus Synechococcus spongiarum 142 TaxID=1608213 RepID=A0A6N3X7W4_9SYNE|nr:MAG: hypothetical protein TH68_02050 [Candidatus Synechococcus spongiarum 142]
MNHSEDWQAARQEAMDVAARVPAILKTLAIAAALEAKRWIFTHVPVVRHLPESWRILWQSLDFLAALAGACLILAYRWAIPSWLRPRPGHADCLTDSNDRGHTTGQRWAA